MDKEQRYFFLDGIRGWGAFAVLLFHVWVQAFPISPMQQKIFSKIIFFNGPLAVSIFFIISGFSLSIGFIKKKDPKILARIGTGRYFRLELPILVVSLLAYIAWHTGLMPPVSTRPPIFQTFLTASPTFLETMKFSFYDVFFHIASKDALDPPLWTMIYEFRGSIAVLGLIFFIQFFRQKFLIYLILIAAILSSSYYYLYAFFPIGMLLCELFYYYHHTLFQRKRIQILLFCLFIISVILNIGFYKVGYLLQSFLAISLTISFIFSKPLNHFMSNQLSRWLGKISFPLYLIHFLVLYTLTLPFFIHHHSMLANCGMNLLTMIVAIIMARLLVCVDQGATHLSRSIGRFFIKE